MATCVALWSADAFAQTPPLPAPDPLSPSLQTNPRQPPRFEKSAKPGLPPLGPPVNTWSPAAGAGITGFDSTNARRRIKPKAGQPAPALLAPAGAIAPAANANPPPDAKAAAAQARAIAPGVAVPLTISRYQTPPPDTSAFANAPGAPPVELGPIRKLPPKLKAHAEPVDPYAPPGVRAGGFDLFPALELIGGYNSNAGQSANGQGAALYTIAPELQAQSNWSRHELKADLRGSYTGYSPDQTPSLSRPYFNGNVTGRIDVTQATRVDLTTRLLVSTDNPGSPNLQAGLAKLPLYATFGGSGGVTHQFNRLELGVKGDVERTTYQASTLTDGTLASNGDRAYNQYAGTFRAAYELKPGLKPYAEAGADSRVHDLSTDFNGFQRDSTGVTAKIGSTFDLPARLTGDVALGYTSRKYADPRFDTLAGLLGNASLLWTASALTTVKLSATSVVNESTVAGVSGVFSRDVGLQIDHALRRWLIVSAKFGFGLTYKLSREVQIKGEVRRNWLHSNVPGNDYTADIFLLGLRLQR